MKRTSPFLIGSLSLGLFVYLTFKHPLILMAALMAPTALIAAYGLGVIILSEFKWWRR